jgi:ABC-type branched-subunit amino acid transport system ATPase component
MYEVISKSIGINEAKRNNIFRNRSSSATEDMIKKLYEAFPQLHDLNHENPDPLRHR